MHRKRLKRKGQAALELVMSLLFFTGMLGIVMATSVYLYLNHVLLTAARDGARAASIETGFASSDTGEQDAAETEVKNRVANLVIQSTGIQLDPTDITITGPTGSVGDRSIEVDVAYDFENPLKMKTFLNRLSGGSETGLDTVTISHSVTMRYEE